MKEILCISNNTEDHTADLLKEVTLQIQYSSRFVPEMECIFLLERHFQSDNGSPRSIPEIREYLSAKYNIPPFELEPLLQPLADVEHYVISNLNVSDEQLRFLFSAPGNSFTSPARALYPALQTHARYADLSEPERIDALKPMISYVLDASDGDLDGLQTLGDLMQYLLHENVSVDIKWICTALYYAADDYLEQLDIILRKATALFLEHLPDTSALCRKALESAQEQLGQDPTTGFINFHLTTEVERVTVLPCLMAFHGMQWCFPEGQLFYGVYYGTILQLVDKYSDQSASLVSRLKSMGDKSRLEILRAVKDGPCNGQDIAEKLALAPATISHHTNLLCNEGLLSATRRGTSIYYELDTENLQHFLRELEHYLL